MSNRTPVAEVYAKAFVDIAVKQGVLDRVCDDLKLMRECFIGNPQLLLRLAMPSLNRNERYTSVAAVFNSVIHPLSLRLSWLLIHRGRTSLLGMMYDAVMKERDKRDGIKDVSVVSAHSLTEEQISEFKYKLSQRFGVNCRVTFSTDEKGIAGYKVSTQESSIDFTVRSGLDKLRKKLLQS